MSSYLKFLRTRIALLPLLIVGGMSAGIVHAQSVWDGGGADNDWTTAANWTGDTAPTSATTTDIQFAGSTRLSPSLASAFTVKSITFNTGAGSFTLGGSTISIAGTPGNPDAWVIRNSSSSALQTIDNNINLTAGTISAGGDITLNGTLTLAGGIRLGAGSGKVLTMNGKITGPTTGNFLAFAGGSTTGTVRINAVNDYVGTTKIWNSIVIISQDALGTGGAFGNSTSTIEMGAASGTNGATLLISGAHRVDRAIRVFTSATNPVTLGGESAAISSFDKDITVGTDSAAAMALTVTSASGGRVNFTGNIVRASGATGSNDTLTKTGAGIVSLNGSGNTYSGTTAVNAGTLLVNGSLASGGGAVSVASSAALGGSGTINRDVSVAGGAIFTPGNFDASGVSQTGTLAVVGALTFADTSLMNFDLGTASDLVAVTGNLTLDGALNVTAGTGFGAGTYQLFSYTGTFINNTVSLGTLPANYNYQLDFSTANQVNLIVTSAIPEPANIGVLLGCISLGALAAFRRKHNA